MSVAALNISTDIDLTPHARQLLAERNIVLHVELEGWLASVLFSSGSVSRDAFEVVSDQVISRRSAR